MGIDDKANQIFGALEREIIKVYRVYDGSDRVQSQYEAYAHTLDGETCLRTDYTYVAASTRVEKMQEYVDVWSSAYDI